TRPAQHTQNGVDHTQSGNEARCRLTDGLSHRRHLHGQPRPAHRRRAEGRQDHGLRSSAQSSESRDELPQVVQGEGQAVLVGACEPGHPAHRPPHRRQPAALLRGPSRTRRTRGPSDAGWRRTPLRAAQLETAPTAADPFEHPDAQRRFRVVADVDELARALEYPWERWTVFLHPAQRELVERRFGGPARIAGSAGTGKTVVALHRAAHLARANPDARILLTTFSETLASALRTKLARLIGTQPRLRERIDVDALDTVV